MPAVFFLFFHLFFPSTANQRYKMRKPMPSVADDISVEVESIFKVMLKRGNGKTENPAAVLR